MKMHTFLQVIQAVFNGVHNKKLPIVYLDGSYEKNYLLYQNQINREVLSADFRFDAVEKQFFFTYIFANDVTARSKFVFFEKVLKNDFINDVSREKFVQYFVKIQRTYHALSKFAYIYKHKTTPILIDRDVYLNTLTEGAPRVFSVVQHKKKYLFSITDLINILNGALGNNYFFIAEPQACKNPYNNLPFNKSTLYNIYFFIKKTDFIMPVMFYQYFLTNFNLSEYASQNDDLIIEYAIKQFVTHTDVEELYDEIINMLESDKFGKEIQIDPEFPQERLVSIMRPYLELYYKGSYLIHKTKRMNCIKEYNTKIRLFHEYNENFGFKSMKKIPKAKNVFLYKATFTAVFNDKHRVFNSEYNDNFHNSHISR